MGSDSIAFPPHTPDLPPLILNRSNDLWLNGWLSSGTPIWLLSSDFLPQGRFTHFSLGLDVGVDDGVYLLRFLDLLRLMLVVRLIKVVRLLKLLRLLALARLFDPARRRRQLDLWDLEGLLCLSFG